MTVEVCIFDAYGTLFDVGAAAREAAAEPGRERLRDLWPRIAELWRLKQLEYSWLRAAAGEHTDFWQVTQDGLDWALGSVGLTDDSAMRERLLELYFNLSCYPEVPQMLASLKGAGLSTGILSNGSPAMLEGAVGSAGIADRLDAVLSVEAVGVFKPAPVVYDMVGARFEVEPDGVLFVSSNGWDACAAAGYGFRTLWVNRAGAPLDRLWGVPEHVASDLTGVPDLVRAL
ncbi:MAG: haloacid dehalogenase type II [Rubricella sp.]